MKDQSTHLFAQHLPHTCQVCKATHETFYAASTCCLKVRAEEPRRVKGDSYCKCGRFRPGGFIKECRHFTDLSTGSLPAQCDQPPTHISN